MSLKAFRKAFTGGVSGRLTAHNTPVTTINTTKTTNWVANLSLATQYVTYWTLGWRELTSGVPQPRSGYARYTDMATNVYTMVSQWDLSNPDDWYPGMKRMTRYSYYNVTSLLTGGGRWTGGQTAPDGQGGKLTYRHLSKTTSIYNQRATSALTAVTTTIYRQTTRFTEVP